MEKNGKGGQKRRIVMNDGSLGERQRMTGSAPEQRLLQATDILEKCQRKYVGRSGT
jgi:hypothetical protein